MRQILLGSTTRRVPQIVLGCMRMSSLDAAAASAVIEAAIESGITMFDHADIYGGGASETVFARTLRQAGIARESLVVQSKCGIRDGCYDFSRKHILDSVDAILGRLDTPWLDLLLLHRPDTLMEPEEVAAAFDTLAGSGKVRAFGVSNFNAAQIGLLRSALSEDILVNQLQFSLANTGMIDSGFNVNMKNEGSVDHDGGVLEYCRLKKITIQAWSPFMYGFFEGVFLGSDRYAELNRAIDEMAASYGVSAEAIVIAWMNRHPARMQTIAGSMNPARIHAMCRGCDIELSREQWYALYRAAGNSLP